MSSHGPSYNTGPGQLMYAPGRDFAYNYPHMISRVIACFNKEYWPGLFEHVCQSTPELTEDQVWDKLVEAKDCYCEFINSLCEDPNESVQDILDRSGFTGLPLPIQLGWLSMLGQVMTGQLFYGIRDVNKQTAEPTCMRDLRSSGMAARQALNEIEPSTERMEIMERLINVAKTANDAGVSVPTIRSAIKIALEQ